MSTSNLTEHINPSTSLTTITLSTLQCEIKLVNNWKKLQLRSRFLFPEIDPIEIKAMMINYYSIYCPLETKLEFNLFTKTYNDIPNINNIISFIKNHDSHNQNHNNLLIIIIELPQIVLPIIQNNGIDKYYFYGFNNKLLLYYNNSEVNNKINNNNKHSIYYKDILLMFNYNGNTNIYDNYTFAHPKNINFELNLYSKCNNIYELNELELEIIPKTNISNNRCVICLSNILYLYESYCRISSCKHIYHYECIENLIKYSNDNQCPLCRGKIKYIQYLNNTINKIFKIKNNTLSIISHKHYFNKYYFNKKNNNTNNTQNNENNDDEYDEKEEGIIACNQIPPKPCLGFLESMPSPTNSNSSISIPPTRQSSPSTPNITQLTLNDNNNNNNNQNINNNNNNNNGNYNNNNNNNNNDNNNGNTTNTKGYFDTNFYDKNAGEDY